MRRMVLLAIASTLAAWMPAGRATADSAGDRPQTRPVTDKPVITAENSFSLQEAIELALVHNPDLIAMRREMGLAGARVATAGQWANNPELGFEYEGDDLTNDEGVREWQVTFLQPFELRGQRGWRKRIAKSAEKGAAQNLRRAEWELRSAVGGGFYQLLFLERSAELAQRRLEVARRLMEIAEARLASQQIPELEVNLVRLEFHKAADARGRMARRQHVAQLRLAWLMGLESGDALTVTGDIESRAHPEPDTPALVQRAIGSRGDLAATRAEVEGAEFRIRLEKSQVWPGAALGFFYRQEDAPTRNGPPQGITRDRLWGVELSLSLPLLNRRGGQIREAAAEREIALARVDAMERKIRREVTEAAETLRRIMETLAIYEGELNRLSEQNLNDVERAFQAGEVGAIAVLKAQDDFVTVTQGYYDALLEYHQAAAEMEATVGPPLSESMPDTKEEEK